MLAMSKTKQKMILMVERLLNIVWVIVHIMTVSYIFDCLLYFGSEEN